LHRQQPEKNKLNFDVASTLEKFLRTSIGCIDFDLILGSQSVVLFGSIILSHSKTINAKVISLPDLYNSLLNAVIKKLYNFGV